MSHQLNIVRAEFWVLLVGWIMDDTDNKKLTQEKETSKICGTFFGRRIIVYGKRRHRVKTPNGHLGACCEENFESGQ